MRFPIRLSGLRTVGLIGSVLVDNTSATNYDHISNLLTPGSTFQYRVTAVNADDEESQPSAVVSGTAAAQSSTNLFTNVSATKASTTSITVSANPYAGFTVAVVDFYVTTDDGNTWKPSATSYSIFGTDQFSRTVTGLSTNTCYGFRVNSTGKYFKGLFYLTKPMRPRTVSATSAPTGLDATADGETAIDLSWTAPTTNKCGPITGYKIEVSDHGGTNFSELVASHSTTTYSHTGLTAGTTRHYRVHAINSVGSSAWSSTANAMTAAVVISFDAASSQVNETTATATIQVNVNPASTSPLTIAYSLGGTARENTDYTIQGSGSLTIASNAISAKSLHRDHQ